MCLTHSVTIVLIFDDLLFDNLIAKFVLIDAVNEIFRGDIVTLCCLTDAFDALLSHSLQCHDLVQAKHFPHA